MNTGFLKMCGPLELVLTEGARVSGRAPVDFSRFGGGGEVAAPFLLLEAMNQFAVRLGRRAFGIPVESGRRVLPVGIRSFAQTAPLTETIFEISGSAVVSGPLAVVTMTACERTSSGASHPAARAEIAVTPSGEPGGGAAVVAPVFPAARGVVETLLFSAAVDGTFAVKNDEAFFAEHFPGSPIAPASLLLELVWKLSRLDRPLDSLVAMSNVRFSRPVTPGGLYRCGIARPEAGDDFVFTVSDGNNLPLLRGAVSGRELIK